MSLAASSLLLFLLLSTMANQVIPSTSDMMIPHLLAKSSQSFFLFSEKVTVKFFFSPLPRPASPGPLRRSGRVRDQAEEL